MIHFDFTYVYLRTGCIMNVLYTLPLTIFFFVLIMFQLLKSEIVLGAQCSTKLSMKYFNITLKE